jgi:N-acetylmuramoyl-L-alanine amidase
MCKQKNKMIYMLLLVFLMVLIPYTSVVAASKLNLYYYGTKKNVTYTGQQVQYYYNGTAINMRNTPGIITDGISLASYKDVFVYSSIGLDYKYDKAKGTVTLSQNNTKLVLTIGSKKATLNGKSVTLSIAPVKVLFKDKNVTKILVPARYVAETFGYTYSWNSATSIASISGPMHLNYNNKNVNYTGTKGQVTVDGKKIELGKMPSIIVNNTALVRAKQVFSASSIGAKYDYNSSKKTLTLTKGDTVVKLTMGSTTAYVNDKANKMDTAPLVVKNLDTNSSYVMVPGSFVATYLGYDYAWNSSAKTSVISTRLPEEEEPEEDEDGPELGDDPTVNDSVLLNWDVKVENLDQYATINNLVNTAQIDTGLSTFANIYNVEKDYLTENNKETYIIRSTSPFSTAIASIQGQNLIVTANNSSVIGTSYTLGGTMADIINTSANSVNLSSDISFHLYNPNIKYQLTLSEDKCSLYVTLYKNYLSNISAGTKAGNEFVMLTGMSNLTVNLTEDGKYIRLEVPYTFNGVGDNSSITSSLKSILSVQSITVSNDMAIIMIERTTDTEYFITQTGNTYMISFVKLQEENSDYELQFNLPSDVDYSLINHEDRYYENKIAILIPGDYRSYYESNPIKSSSDVVKSVSVSYKSNCTEILITTTKLQGYRLEENNGLVGVVLGNPRDIYQNIVVLDAGHGGTDPGAIRSLNGKTINEKELNFKIMYQLTQKYFNAEDSNIKVYYSRYNDTKVDLYERAAFATKVGADLFVSLHMNANTSTSPSGTEIYYTGTNKSTTSSGLNSKTLATMFLNELPGKIGTKKRYISDQNLVVTRETKVPAILVELGFMSNPDDLVKITDSSVQEKAAKAMYDILCDVFESYPTGR